MRLSTSLFAIMLLLLVQATLLSACGAQTLAVTPKPSPIVMHKPSPTVAVSPTVTTLTPETTPAAAVPARLVIPRIGVNAIVEDVGINSNGGLATPTKNPWEGVGWYSYGTRPGAEGSAVIDGHVDRPGGYPAIFWNLRYLQRGDTVMVVTSQGQTLRFRVLRIASYPPNQAPVQGIFETTGGVFLNLITCTGTWIPSQHQTTLRLVVYTVMG